jgi:hypothetical protein
MGDKYWEMMWSSFVRYRGEIMNQALEIKTLMKKMCDLQNEYLYILQHRDEIQEDIREKAIKFLILNHTQNLYHMADIVMLFQDGRMLRINQFNSQLACHKTSRKNHFHDQFTTEEDAHLSPVTLTLLSIDGFEFERSKLIRMNANDQLICIEKVFHFFLYL